VLALNSYTGEAFTRKDVAYNLYNESDPEAEAAIKAFQRQAYAAAAKGAAALAPAAEAELAFTAKVERKYVAAQIVESGIQVRAQASQEGT
jgi:DNA topoisomerase IB